MKKKYYIIPELFVSDVSQNEAILTSPASEGLDTFIDENDLKEFGEANGWF